MSGAAPLHLTYGVLGDSNCDCDYSDDVINAESLILHILIIR